MRSLHDALLDQKSSLKMLCLCTGCSAIERNQAVLWLGNWKPSQFMIELKLAKGTKVQDCSKYQSPGGEHSNLQASPLQQLFADGCLRNYFQKLIG